MTDQCKKTFSYQGVKRLSCITSGRLYGDKTSIFMSFPAKLFDVNVVDRSQTKYFFAESMDIVE